MSVIFATALGALLSIVLVICLHFAAIDMPSIAPYKDFLALFCIFLGLSFATLATRWCKNKKKIQINDSSINVDFNAGDHSGPPSSPPYGTGSGGGAGSTRIFASKNISPTTHQDNFSVISLASTTDKISSIDADQIGEGISNGIMSAVDVGEAVEVGGELGEAVCEIVGSILE